MAKSAEDKRGLILNIQRFSVHDGPGIRDLVFMKGCPLRCLWCSNPEAQNYNPEIAFIEGRCIGCGWCKEACQAGAITILPDGKASIEKSLCNDCGKCVEICPAQAIKLFGEYMSVDDVVRVVEEDSAFYYRSGGGITVSGGEPLSQAEFVHELLKSCRERGIDTAVEISGHANWEDVERVCRYANLIFYDIKHIDSGKHKAFAGVTNELILENIRRIASNFPKTPIVARTPIVPGFTDTEDNIKAIADFLSQIGSLKQYELLPYHGFGKPKYHQLGREYSLSSLQTPSQECMAILQKLTQKATAGCKISR